MSEPTAQPVSTGGSQGKKKKVRTSSSQLAGLTPAVAPIPDTLRTQMAENVADLIFLAQDVSLSIASVNCPNRENCPLYNSAKQLATKVQEFLRMQRQSMPRPVTR